METNKTNLVREIQEAKAKVKWIQCRIQQTCYKETVTREKLHKDLKVWADRLKGALKKYENQNPEACLYSILN